MKNVKFEKKIKKNRNYNVYNSNDKFVKNENNKFINLRKYDLESILERPNIMNMPSLNHNNNNDKDNENIHLDTLESENNISSKVNTYSNGFKTAVVKTSLLRQPLLRKLNISDKEKEIENKIIDEELLKDCEDCNNKINLEKIINKY